MHPVNIQLNLSGTRQLEFLEEIISLLHVHQDAHASNRERDSDLPVGMTSSVTGTQLPHMPSPCVNDEGVKDDHDAASANMDTDLTSPPLGSFFNSAPQSHHNHCTNFSGFGDGSSIFPHPPASPPPQGALSAMKFRRMVRPHSQKHHEFELNPHHYLNEAELAVMYSHQPLSFALSNVDVQPSATACSGTMSTSTKDELKRKSSMCRSDYWLKDSSEPHLQDWLLKKDKECLLQRRNNLIRHQLKCKEREAKVIQKIEKAKQSKLAYQTWLDRKREEDKMVMKKRPESVHPVPLRESMVQPKTKPEQPSSVQLQPCIIRRPIKSFKQKRKHIPLKDQQQNSNSTSSTSKRMTFKEWVQLKERDRKSMKSKSVKDCYEGQVPEDLQKITRGMRKLRLQQKDCSKKHVDSGLVKKKR